MNPRIRPLRRDDVPLICDFGRNVPEFVVDNKHAFWSIDTLDRFVQEGLSFVVEDQTHLVGFLLAVYQPVTRKLTWENMYLAPSYRGRGLAQTCFGRSWKAAQQRGAIMVEGIVATSNTASQALLTRLGFQNVGTYYWMLKFSS